MNWALQPFQREGLADVFLPVCMIFDPSEL